MVEAEAFTFEVKGDLLGKCVAKEDLKLPCLHNRTSSRRGGISLSYNWVGVRW